MTAAANASGTGTLSPPPPPRVFLTAVPKAGAHLAEKALTLFGLERGGPPFGSATLYGRRRWWKALWRRPWWTADLVLVGIELVTPVRRRWVARRLDAVPPRRYARGHVPYGEPFARLLDDRGFRVLHLVRDPRDVAVSHAHYVLARPRHLFHRHYRRLGEWGAQVAFSITGGFVPGVGHLASLAERYRSMEGWRDHPGALTLRFEDLVGERGGGARAAQLEALRRLGDWVGAAASPEALERLADSLFGGTSTFRQGRLGGWQDHFDERCRSLFDEHSGELLARWGYGPETVTQGRPARG